MSDGSIGTATVMFTDLVGSTELRTRVGEDAAETMRATHDRVLTSAITGAGGRVVKHLGDGVMATFASAAQAVAAAVAVQQGIEFEGRRPEAEPMRLRIGLSAGDVTFDDDDLFGLPVVEAQRLEASAAPGTIRCAELVMHLARGRGGHRFSPLGELELKGLAEPLAACEVMWEPLAERETATPAELPSALAGQGLPFSGRDDIFTQLVDRWKECAVGGFEAVLLAGEPGVGKTRLAQELAQRIHGDGALVLAGRCDEDVSVPFQAFGTALEWFVRHAPPGEVTGLLGDFPGDLARLVPHLSDLVPHLPPPLRDDPETERFRLFQAVESWLATGSGEQPRLLVIDDLHWADKPTLLALRHVITNRPGGVMVLCTYRDTDVDRTHPLSAMLADFRRMDQVTRLTVDGLGQEGVRELLVRTGGHDLDEAGLRFAELVQRETSGNPFFVSEVLRHLAETGALVERDGRWTSDLSPEDAGIPEGVREVVGRRLSRLGDDVERVLRAAAVIGYEFDVDLLADVVAHDPDEVLDALDTAAAANLVIEVGVDRHRFAHALVRETLHDELSSSRRARQHRKVAEALELRHAGDLDEVVTELATHWAEASAGGDPTRAIELAMRAGELAADRSAHENAAGWYRMALDLIDDGDGPPELRRQVQTKLAEAQSVSGQGPEGRANALDAARASIAAGDCDTATAALSISSRISFSENDPADPERVAVLRDALGMAGLVDRQRAVLVNELATELIFERDIEGRRQALDERRRLLPAVPLDERVTLLSSPGAMVYADADREELSAAVRAILDADDLEMSPWLRRRMNSTLYFFALQLGDRRSMDVSLERSAAVEDSGALHVGLAASGLSKVMDLVLRGELAAAESLARDTVARLETLGLPEAAVYRTTTSLSLAWERGTLAEMTGLAGILATMGHPAGPSRAIAAFIEFVGGDRDGVASTLDSIEQEEFADDAGYPIVLGYWSEIAACVGSEPQRRRLVELLRRRPGTIIGTGGLALGPADRLLALLHDALGEHDLADGCFSAAVELATVVQSPTWIARTQLDWAQSLMARGDREGAAASLSAAEQAIGDLDLVESRSRLADLRERLASMPAD